MKDFEAKRSIYSIAIFLGATLLLSFTAQPIFAQSGIGNDQSYISNIPNTTFVGNATQITNGTVAFNLLGTGGNDTFDVYGGNASAVFIVNGAQNSTFNIVTGNPGNGINSTTFSLISGDNSTFNIIQSNFNGSVSISIIGGSNCFVNDTSVGPVNNTIFLINLGSNGTVILNSKFTGETMINEVDPITHMTISQTNDDSTISVTSQVNLAPLSDTASLPSYASRSAMHPTWF
jgi:hypothetical protein